MTPDNIDNYLDEMALSEGEREEVIHQLVKELESNREDQSDDETNDAGRWKDRDDIDSLHGDAPLAKRARYADDSGS